jgi:threonine dehydratase
MPLPAVNLAKIEQAAHAIDPVFRNSPQYEDTSLSAALGRRVLLKVETANPIRSFKGRGADFFVQSIDPRQKIVCASAGNFGQAVAYAGRTRGITVEVFAATDVNPAKADRMRALGATVTLAGADFDAAKQNACRRAAEQDCIFVEDGAEDAITEGAGTIAIELLTAGSIDSVIVPLGDGALINGVAAWMKHRSPGTRVIGVCAKGSPAMRESWKQGHAVKAEADTIADGIAVSAPVAKSVELIKTLVDDIVLVDDQSMIEAMRLSLSALGLLLEPSGAAGLAAILRYNLPGDRLATILTGSNIHPQMLATILEAGARHYR